MTVASDDINQHLDKLFDPMSEGDIEDFDPAVACKQCGKRDLYWSDHVDGWRLENAEGAPHHCKHVEFRGATEGFESIE